MITGDYHESFASDLPADLGAYVLEGHSVAVEFVAPGVTSPGYGDTIALIPGTEPITAQINTVFEANFATSNRWIKYHDGFRSGFGVLELRADAAQFDFVHLVDKTKPNTPASVSASMQTVRGSSKVTHASGPLRALQRETIGAIAPPTAPTPSAGDTGQSGNIPATGGLPPALPLAAAATAAAVLVAKRSLREPARLQLTRPSAHKPPAWRRLVGRRSAAGEHVDAADAVDVVGGAEQR